MAGGAHRRQPRPRLHRSQETASLPIPDELLVDIFLRLSDPADLAHASAACFSFRLLIADRSFLRHYRRLHAPPLLGFLDSHSKAFHPAAPPHPSASGASALALAAGFSFSFLPPPARNWLLRDIRDGRVLLEKRIRVRTATVVFPEVVVCDPLHRRYLRLPPVPDDLAASVEDPFLTKKKQLRVEIFLAPTSDGEEEADETSFRVMR